jgi:poly(A) polymerase
MDGAERTPGPVVIDSPMRAEAVRAVERLRGAGFTAYFAGGCVRDALLGRAPKDYDIATDATPERVKGLFPRSAAVGESFGVILVRTGEGPLEVATFREDAGYSDKRRPDAVRFSTPAADAQRRDFTINALFLDPLAGGTGEVIDFVGGRRDLEAGVVRAVGDPGARLAEDHLRALRAVRFACRLGFALDAGTAGAIRAHAAELSGVSRERIGDELRRMLGAGSRGRAVRMLRELGLDRPALGESGESGVAGEGLGVVEGLAEDLGSDAVAVGLAAWAVDRRGAGVATDGKARGDLVRGWRRALCLSNDESAGLRGVLEVLGVLLREWEGLGVAGRKRVAVRPGFSGSMAILGVIEAERAAVVRGAVDELAGDGVGLAPVPLIDGNDLIGLGWTPGPGFARALDAVYDAQLEGRVSTKSEGLALAGELGGDSGV